MEEKSNKIEEKSDKKFIKEICLSGACNRGISYLGCFKKMEELEILKLEKIVGTSIGTLVGACYIIGYTTDELMKVIVETDTKIFKDISFKEEGAILKGKEYRQWVFDILLKKIDPNITLIELFKKTSIYFIATTTCINSTDKDIPEGINYLSHLTVPDMPLVTAINCSMAFPFIFPPIVYKGCYFIDGGVLDNFPFDLVSEDAIGLLVNFQHIDGLESIKNPIFYVGKIYELIYSRFTKLQKINELNTIKIEANDFNLIDFNISIDDKITLFMRGYNKMSDFFKYTYKW